MELEPFNLDKIRNFIQPIEEIEGKLNRLSSIRKEVFDKFQKIKQVIEDDESLDIVNEIVENLDHSSRNLESTSQINLNKYLKFYNSLIRKYKEKFKSKLIESKIDEEKVNSLGLNLIETKNLSRVVSGSSYIKSLNYVLWSDLIDSLKKNTLFRSIIKNFEDFYNKILEGRFQRELEKIPEGTEDELIKDYREIFFDSPNTTFNDYLEEIKSKLTSEELKEREKVIRQAEEKEKFESLKKKQEMQRDTYEEYLKYSEEEFQRRRRRKKRQTLTDLVAKSKKGDELTEDVAEKIDTFKKKLNRSFEDKYLIQNEADQDPLDLVRERKEKKQKEYKKHIKKFENNNDE